MPYWTTDTLGVRLAQLIQDCEDTAAAADGLDAQTDGSPPSPGSEPWDWAEFADYLDGDDPADRPLTEELRALQKRLPRADDQDLAEGHKVVGAAYDAMHMALPAVDPWTTHLGPVRHAAEVLRSCLAGAEDEAHRVLSGYGDLRRSKRRGLL